MSLRVGVSIGAISIETAIEIVEYTSPVALFGSGYEAARHGLAELADPSEQAARITEKVARRR